MSTLFYTAPARPPGAISRALGRTPRRLMMLGAALEATVAVFVAVLVSGMSGADRGMAAISAKAAEAKTADDLYLRLTDMDAQAADALLVGYHPTGSVPREVGAAADMQTYDSERSAADADLQLIGLDPALAAKVRSLLDALGGYESLIGQALYIDQNTNAERPAAPPRDALGLYEQATASLHTDILATAAQIRDEDDRDVDDQYALAGDAELGDGVLIVIAGLFLIVLIAAANLFLSRRFRRTVGPALALAALVVAALTASALADLLHAGSESTVAKRNAFDSVSALTNAEAVSYDANADESKWLLDGFGTYQADFFADVDQIAHTYALDAGTAAQDPASYYSALEAATTRLTLDGAQNTVSHVELGGYLGDELGNVTFDGEARAAFDAADAFNSYLQIDSTIRGDANSGDLTTAVNVDIGLAPGDSNYSFGQYINAMRHVVDINQTAFTAAIADGETGLAVWNWLPYAAGAVLLGLVAAALYPRLREYR
ncbi:MAG TPA: hypothetical protein VFU73_08045 [Actinocrinis sp.]|nr:hypothetical protein [Actinocrinis sp.]